VLDEVAQDSLGGVLVPDAADRLTDEVLQAERQRAVAVEQPPLDITVSFPVRRMPQTG
jgi:hypothetical protein